MRSKLIVILLVFGLFSTAVFADISSFQDDLSYAVKAKSDSLDKIKNFDPHQNFKNYTDHPDQTKYYTGVQQSTDNGMDSDAQSAITKNDTGSAINNDYNTRPKYQVNPKSDEMLKGKFIQSDATDIALGISDKYVDCTKPKDECKTEYVNKTCNEAIGSDNVPCVKNLQVKVTQPTIDNCQHLLIADSTPADAIKKIGQWSTGIPYTSPNWAVWLVRGPDQSGRCAVGYVYDHGAEAAARSDTFKVPAHFSGTLLVNRSGDFCYTYDTEISANLTTNTGVSLYVQTPWNTEITKELGGDINSDRSLELTLQNHHWHKECDAASYGEVMVPYTVPPVVTDTWVDHCTYLEERAGDGICRAVKNSCTSGKAMHLINGLDITRDCWAKTFQYNCQIAPSDNDCQYLRDQGCTQTGQSCKVKIGDLCVVQNESYECPEKHCSPADGIICGGEFFCMNGKCSNHDSKANKHFKQGVAGLAAVGAAGDDVRKQNINPPHIFSGTAMECSDDALGFKNCCRNTGWGKDSNLAHCTSDEKKLGEARQNGLVVPAGSETDDDSNRYCNSHAPVTHTCTSHHKVYCVFPGKIARIVEWQGRWGQLKKNFGSIYGSTSNPDCSGITPDELQDIDFSKIDFKDIYDDITNNTNIPDTNKIEQDIIQKIKDQVK